MAEPHRTRDALVVYLERYDRLVEVGIGRRTDVAVALAERGVSVTATDVRPRPVPDPVRFVEDDVVDPDLDVYEGAEAIYALNLPSELHRPTRAVARQVEASFLFTTLGFDQPTVPIDRVRIPGETVYVAVDDRGR